MRILFIVTAFPRSPEDVITPWLLETIDRLRRRGVEVEVLAPSYRGLGDQVMAGVRVHRFRYAPARLETLTHDQTTPDRIRERPQYLGLVPGYILAGSLAAVRLARSRRFDLIHAFWPLPHGVFGLASRILSGVPLVSTFFGVELTWMRQQLPLLAPLLRGIVQYSDAVTVISSHTEREVRRLVPAAEVRTIPFGAAFAPPQKTVDESRPARTRSGRWRLLFVGRLVERKGVSILLAALAELRREADVGLTIVGDGPQRGSLERLARRLEISDAVSFRGFVPGDELRRCYAASDIFVLPAVQDSKGDVEGLGVVLIEALQHGVPIVASSSGGIPDIVRHERTGILVEPGDPNALAVALRRLIDRPELAHALAAAGHNDVIERFSWERIISDLESLYDDVIVRRDGRGSGPRTLPVSSA